MSLASLPRQKGQFHVIYKSGESWKDYYGHSRTYRKACEEANWLENAFANSLSVKVIHKKILNKWLKIGDKNAN